MKVMTVLIVEGYAGQFPCSGRDVLKVLVDFRAHNGDIMSVVVPAERCEVRLEQLSAPVQTDVISQ